MRDQEVVSVVRSAGMTRRRMGGIVLAAAALAALPGAAMAEGMPQLDFANPLTIWQVIWGAVIFLVLYFLYSRWALPMVGGVLHTRAERITGDLEAARAAKQAADAAVTELTAATAAARAQAQAAINDAVAEAKQAAAAQAAALNAKLDAQLAEADAQIARARAQVMRSLGPIAKVAATNMMMRLTGAAPDREKISETVDAVVAARVSR